MFDKLFQAQQKAEEVKKRLDAITVSGEAEGGKIRVSASGNKELKDIHIDPEFYAQTDAEALGELLVIATNKALSQADSLSQAEMQAVTKDMLGGMGGLFGQ
jgi:DNA-binding YbaB/EbfC family protein